MKHNYKPNMVMYCVVPECKSNAFRPGISFHLFPTDPQLKRIWKIKIRRDDRYCKEVSASMRICSEHFLPSDFRETVYKKRRYLKKGAIPSVFSFNLPSEDSTIEIDSCTTKTKFSNRNISKLRSRRSSTININKQLVKKIEFDSSKASIEDLKQKTLELWEKNAAVKKEIESLKNESYEEGQLQWYIDTLHEYNDIKDVAQKIMGTIAVNEKTTVRKIHEEFGMTDSD